ncbi:MAG: hypothetical protein L6264_13375 [Weeksellaceae bacterium]|nr:hypothetical protein [Bacteroidota bacterium]MCG2781928.1 hypothetical protein [Weeksellaceae bacterium]
MKKIFILTLFFLFISGNSQTYSFDFLTKYVSGEKAKQHETVMYFNTDDFSYYLKILRTPYDFTAYLFDENLMKIHQFNIIEQKNNSDITFVFQYKSSGKLTSNQKQYKNYQFVFNEISYMF